MSASASRNWNPDCRTHGTGSAWYRSPEQQAARSAQDRRLADIQSEARRVRHGGTPKPACGNCGTQHFSWTDTLCEDYSPLGPAT